MYVKYPADRDVDSFSTSQQPTGMSLSRLPLELLQAILVLALEDHDCPSDVLRVHRTFFELGQPLLHTHLRFRSIAQLSTFAQGEPALVCAPKTLVITLAGGAADFEVFKHLEGALLRCRRGRSMGHDERDDHAANGPFTSAANEDVAQAATQVDLDLLSLRLHSHSRNPLLNYIHEAPSLAK